MVFEAAGRRRKGLCLRTTAGLGQQQHEDKEGVAFAAKGGLFLSVGSWLS